MKSFFVEYVGCTRRMMDAERIKQYLLANGLDYTDNPGEADYIFLITCGLNKVNEDRCVDFIKDYKQMSGELVVCGCMPSMNPQKVKAVYGGRVVHTYDLDGIDGLFPEFTVKFGDLPDVNRGFTRGLAVKRKLRKMRESGLGLALKDVLGHLSFRYHGFMSRHSNPVVFNNDYLSLRISYGCLGSCSYCNIKKAIGRLRSKPVDVLLEELRRGVSEGRFMVNIISSDTGAYGLDIGETFPGLLKAILDEDERVTVEYVEDLHANWVVKYRSELVDLVGTGRVNSILTAVQSGSDRLLKLMRRHTSLEEYKKALDMMREANPELKLRTQVIVGFPTESEEDFQETIGFLRAAGFDEVDVFRYYEVETMDSAVIEPKVPEDVVVDRMDRIEELFSEGELKCSYNIYR
ncbi:MAG: radical SAM protein [Candidatus Altiarchaeales archaeon]|nr:radical SAM protein [Candidatus Altiarchaeales archaeon]